MVLPSLADDERGRYLGKYLSHKNKKAQQILGFQTYF
jgi:hypothetical protein